MSETRTGPMAVMRWSALDIPARDRLLQRGIAQIFDPRLRDPVGRIVEDVREHGDAAVVRALAEFDGCEVAPEGLRITEDELERAEAEVAPAVREALREGIANVRAFNEHLTARREWRVELRPGLEVGEKTTAIASVGLFVPSGKGSFPSVLVQIGTPAVVAGVPEISVVVPPVPGRGGVVDPAVLCVARELGIARVFRANGPAGVAALAFGTESIPRVRKVLGPGSPPVQAAQIACQAHGCHTQMLLGPSESMIVADDSADPRLLAADLLNEAEHGPDSSSLLVTDSAALVEAAQRHLAEQLAALPEPRRAYAAAALGDNGGAILVDDLDEAIEVTNTYAPEHMQIVARDEDRVLAGIQHAGEILLGQHTPISAANYVVGVPAALPTGGFARVTGGVTAETFLKKASIAKAGAEALERMAPAVLALAEHEGFPAHAAAVRARVPGTSTATNDEEERAHA
ncbi:MAG: histidinol dehydrogenase [Solirubrobacteraceae bacterium]